MQLNIVVHSTQYSSACKPASVEPNIVVQATKYSSAWQIEFSYISFQSIFDNTVLIWDTSITMMKGEGALGADEIV